MNGCELGLVSPINCVNEKSRHGSGSGSVDEIFITWAIARNSASLYRSLYAFPALNRICVGKCCGLWIMAWIFIFLDRMLCRSLLCILDGEAVPKTV